MCDGSPVELIGLQDTKKIDGLAAELRSKTLEDFRDYSGDSSVLSTIGHANLVCGRSHPAGSRQRPVGVRGRLEPGPN